MLKLSAAGSSARQTQPGNPWLADSLTPMADTCSALCPYIICSPPVSFCHRSRTGGHTERTSRPGCCGSVSRSRPLRSSARPGFPPLGADSTWLSVVVLVLRPCSRCPWTHPARKKAMVPSDLRVWTRSPGGGYRQPLALSARSTLLPSTTHSSCPRTCAVTP